VQPENWKHGAARIAAKERILPGKSQILLEIKFFLQGLGDNLGELHFIVKKKMN
jgi:hypothetical protein